MAGISKQDIFPPLSESKIKANSPTFKYLNSLKKPVACAALHWQTAEMTLNVF